LLQELEPRVLLAAGGLSFKASPTAVVAGVPMPAVQVQVLNSSGEPDATSSDPVTIALATDPGGAGLQGTVTEDAANGVATFSDLVITTAIPAPGFALVATSGSATSPTSTPFPVEPGPYQLAFTAQPATTVVAGAPLGTITVQVDDQNGLPVALPGNPRVTLYLDTNPTGASLQGTTTATLVNGLATFTGVSVTQTGVYSLGVASPTPATSFLKRGASSDFTVTNAAPATVAFVNPPLASAPGQTINAGLTPAGVGVAVLDQYGNRVLDGQPAVNVALVPGSNTGTLSGTTSVAAVNGVAIFSDLAISAAGTGYILSASVGQSTPVNSLPFGVSARATKLVFTKTASDIVPDGGNLPEIDVSVEDVHGNVETGDNTTQVTIKLAIPAGGLGGNLYGVLTEPVQNGVAVFKTLYIQQVALNGHASTDFNLVASSSNRTNLATDMTSFTVGPGAPARFIITQGANQPNIMAGQTLQPVTIQLVDADSNPIVNSPAMNVSFGILPNGSSAPGSTNPIQQINIYVNGSTSPQLYDTMPLLNGTATFSGIAINQPNVQYTYAIGTTDLNLPAVRSASTFNVTNGQLDHLVFLSTPLTSAYNTVISTGGGIGPALQVALEDSTGHILTNDSTTVITLTADTSMVPAGAPPVTLEGEGFETSGTVQLQVTKGVAFFNRVLFATTSTLTTGFDGYAIVASADQKSVTSSTFTLNLPPGVPAMSVAFTQQPQVQAGSFPQPIALTVHVTYAGGTVPGNQFVQFYLTSNPQNATVTGTPATSVISASGDVTITFPQNFSVSAPGTYVLGAVVKVGGAFTLSNSFTIPVPDPGPDAVTSTASTSTTTDATTEPDTSTATADDSASSSSSIVQVGLGSLTTSFSTISNFPIYNTNADGTPATYPPSADDFPPSYAVPDGVVPNPVSPTVAPGFTQVPDTSDWWSSLIFRRNQVAPTDTTTSRDSKGNQIYPIFPEPLAAMVASNGLGLANLGTPTITPARAPTSLFPAQTDPRAPGNVAFNQVYGGTAQDNQSPNPGTHVDDRLFQDLVVGLQGLNVDAVPSSYSDWTVTLLWNDPVHPLYATLGEGLPYAYFMAPNGGVVDISAPASLYKQPTFTAVDASGASATSGTGPLSLTVSYTVKVLTFDVNNNPSYVSQTVTNTYGIFLPANVGWQITTDSAGTPSLTTSAPLTRDNGYFSVATLPDNTAATFNLFLQHAYSFVTGSTASYHVDDSTGLITTAYVVTTNFVEPGSGHVDSPIQALYPNQYLVLGPGVPLVPDLSYASSRGPMDLVASKSFTTVIQDEGGTLPFIPDVPNGDGSYHTQLFEDQILPYLISVSTYAPRDGSNFLSLDKLIIPGDVYASGQNLLGAMQMVPLLFQVAQDPGVPTSDRTLAQQLADRVFNLVKDGIGSWLSAQDDQALQLLYYQGGTGGWDALLAEAGAFGSSVSINDQNLGFGYYLKTAALIAQYDPTWGDLANMGAIIDLIVKEVANPDRDNLDSRFVFPFLRNFDVYDGRSLADGAGNSSSGNNQESSSESIDFSTGLIQWGEATGDLNLQNLGEYLYDTEVNAFYDYYFNENPNTGTYPPGFSTTTNPRTFITNVSDNGGSQTTFFGLETSKVLGIQVLPINGSSYYLAGRLPTIAANSAYINQNVTYALLNPAQAGVVPISGDVYLTTTYDYQALSDPQTALASYMAKLNADNLTPFNGNGADNNAVNLQWINVLLQYGNVDTSVTANTVNYVVFNKNGVRTYVAFNPEPYASDVTFNLPGGATYLLHLPAKSEVAQTVGTDGTVTSMIVNGIPDLALDTSMNNLFLVSTPNSVTTGTLMPGQTGAGEQSLTIPAGTGTATNPINLPPTDPSKVLTFTASGLSGTLDPTQLPQFSIWLDPGYITTNVSTQAPVIRAQLTIDPDGTGQHDVSEIFDGTVNLALGKPGYVEYNSSEVQVLGAATLPATLTNGKVTLTLWERIGTTAVQVRTDAAEQQGRVSTLTVPYLLKAALVVPSPVAATATFVTSNQTLSAPGTPVVFTATVVAPGVGATPTGSVQFVIDGTPYGSPVALVGGLASAPAIATLAVGTHAVEADYLNSDGQFADSVGMLAGGQVVVAAVSPGPAPSARATLITLTASPASPSYDQPVTFTATVAAAAPGSPTPTGTIQFLVDGQPFGPPVSLVGGVATSFAIGTLAPGAHVISAVYSGDSNHASGSPVNTIVSVASTPASVFVTTLYRELLGHDPDVLALHTWVDRLAEGVRPAVIARDIAGSRERRLLFRHHKAPKISEAKALAAALKASGYKAKSR
jgi:endoglucanase Acf2